VTAEPGIRRGIRRFFRLAIRSASLTANDIDGEIDFHLRERREHLIARGYSPEDAGAEARRRFGEIDAARARLLRSALRHDASATLWDWERHMDTLMQDLRYAARTLARSRGLTAVALLTLILGIGGNLAIFGIVNAVLLQPLPFARPERLVRVFDDLPGAGAKNVGLSVPELVDLNERAGVFEGVSGLISASAALAGGERVERVEFLGTSPNYFELLGAKAAIGRTYGQAEWSPGFLDGVVISDALWHRQFGADPSVIGRRIRVDEDPYTIIGVMPPGFRHPGQTLSGDVDIWSGTGFSADPFPTPPARGVRLLGGAIGRLKPGLTLQQAQRRLDVLAVDLQRTYPNDYPSRLRWSLRVESAQTSLTGGVRPTLALLFIAAIFVLLIVCVNIASLLLARSTVRTREFAVRKAIGASSARLARQVLTESVLLSLIGGAAATVMLRVTQTRLLALIPPDIPRMNEIQLDWPLVAFSLVVSIGAGILFGLTPALRAAGIAPVRGLQVGGRTGGAQSIGQRRARSTLVVIQIALSVVLLVGAGLLLRSFAAVLRTDPGLDPDGLIDGQVWVPVPNHPEANKYLTASQQAALAKRLLDQLESLPGVTRLAVASSGEVPFSSATSPLQIPFSLPDEAATHENDHAASFGAVSAHYFDVLGTTVKRGRVFTEQDDARAPYVVVVNEAFARRFSPRQDPVGRRVQTSRGIELEIVGVVEDIRTAGLDASPEPHVYGSILQFPTVALAVLMRTHTDVKTAEVALTRAVAEVDRELPVFGVRTMRELMSASVARRRFSLALVSAFAGSALLLAAIGLYGVMSFLVGQRSQEFGIRLALGAPPRAIAGLAARPALSLALVGVLLGLVLSLIMSRWLSALVFDVSTSDPLTFASVGVLLVAVATVACLVPARRATRVSPLDALRS